MAAPDASSMFAPATTKRASEVVYDQIYNKIVSGELRSGDRLPSERALAEQFQRSRHIIREALRMLQQDGLIRIEVGSAGGAIVQGVSMQTVEDPLKKFLACGAVDLEDLMEYRYISDHGCARLAAKHYTEADAVRLGNILKEAKSHLDDPDKFFEDDMAFHRALGEASHNQLAYLINDVLTGLSIRMNADAIRGYSPEQLADYCGRVYENHVAIYQAVLRRDPAAADQALDATVDLFHEPFGQRSE